MENNFTVVKELIHEVLTYERLSYTGQLALEQCLKILEIHEILNSKKND